LLPTEFIRGEQDPSYFTLDDISVQAAPGPVPGAGILSFGAVFAAFASSLDSPVACFAGADRLKPR
jgi:hypothetical protein